jgi:HlyD family secretion protein
MRWQRIRTSWFGVVWLAISLVTYVLHQRSVESAGGANIKGMVESDAISVSAVDTGRILTINVTEGQQVKKGDILVQLDSVLMENDVTADRIDAVRVRTDVDVARLNVIQTVNEHRDVMLAVEEELAACRQEWRREQAELASLKTEQVRRDTARSNGYIDELVRAELLPSIAALEKAVAEYPVRIAGYEKRKTEAELSHRNVMEWLGTTKDEPVSAAMDRRLNTSAVHELLAQADAGAVRAKDVSALSSPCDGIVSLVRNKAGDVAVVGIPIIRIVPQTLRRITAYLPPDQVRQLALNAQVDVRPANRPASMPATAQVVSISPEIDMTAGQVSMTGTVVPIRAQRISLTLLGAHDFIGGEAVYVSPVRASWLARLATLFQNQEG